MNLSKNQWIGVVIALIVIFIFFFQFFGDIFFSDSSISEPNELQFVMNQDEQPSVNGVAMTTLQSGDGAEAVRGSLVTVHYTGTFEDGTVFDSSVSRGEPFQFILGAGQVIQGWDSGVLGMKVGEKRQLVIEPEAAYGPGGIQDPRTGQFIIPPNATLTFEVELLGVESIAPTR